MKGTPPKRLGWELAPALVAFLALALWQLRDVLGRWDSCYLGGGELEGWLWRYWWMKRLVAAAWAEPSVPLGYVAYVAAVAGSYPETGNVLDLQLFSWPLEALLGDPLYYNVKVLLVLLLNGLAGFALGWTLFRDGAAATVCGLAVGGGPYLLQEIDNGRIRHAILFPLPLYALWLIRLWRGPSLRVATRAGVFAGLSAGIYLYYGMAAALFTLLWVGWMSLARPEGPLTWRRLGFGAVALGVAIAVTLPFAWSYVDRRSRGQEIPEVSWFRPFPSLAELTSPNPETVLKQQDPLVNSLQRFRADSLPWQHPFMVGHPSGLPLVFTTLSLLALPLAWGGWRGRTLPPEAVGWRALAPWAVGAAFFYVLTLGPYLKSGPSGEYLAMAEGGVATPYVWLFQWLPFFSRLFSPVRMSALLLVCMGVLSGAAFHHLSLRLGIRPPLRWLGVLAVWLALVVGLQAAGQVPVRVSRYEVPAFYHRLAGEPPCMVVELPFRTGDFAQFYQVAHGQKLLMGWSDGGLPPGFPRGEITRLAWSVQGLPENSFFRWLEEMNVRPGQAGSFQEGDLAALVGETGLRYLIVHERGCHLVNPRDGRGHYQQILEALKARFGPPMEIGVELAQERPGAAAQPSRDGLYEHGLAVFRVLHPSLQGASQPRTPGGAQGPPPGGDGGVP